MSTSLSFLPRSTFPLPTDLPRSYFLGHHKASLTRIKSLLNIIDIVIECRDYRVPLTSRNPLFEDVMRGKERCVVYTKTDLGGGLGGGGGGGGRGGGSRRKTQSIISSWHAPSPSFFIACNTPSTIKPLLTYLRDYASKNYSLTGHRAIILGMPNVGKSTLLNTLRRQGVNKGKAAETGDKPGVTRKLGGVVKIVRGEDDVVPGQHGSDGAEREKGKKGSELDGVGGGVYVLDTPGVFVPYVPSAYSMLRLGLTAAIKDSLIPHGMLADYLLYHVNLHDPQLYAEYSPPTNDVESLLAAIAHKTGRLGAGGVPDLEAAAAWWIYRWRNGDVGRFLLDDVREGAYEEALEEREREGGSYHAAVRKEKGRRRKDTLLKNMKV